MHDHAHMAHALRLGARGLGQVWPNPAVGCVIEKGGRVLGRGFTQTGGRPHAEVMALAQAGEDARGATAHVTLEPCAHFGHTPPCAAALIAAGVARVSYAVQDPDPRVAGKGGDMLRAAGIEVVSGLMADEARADHAGFFKRVTQGLPMVTLKLATSLDGRIAMPSGESQWITAPPARAQVHSMRAAHDAVMVGSGTALADDPMLTVRGMGAVRQPVRVVVDSALRLPLGSKLAHSLDIAPLWLLHGPNAPPEHITAWTTTGATLIECPQTQDGHITLHSALSALAARGLTRVFCEGGGGLGAALLRAGLVDDLALFSAGLALGGDAIPALGSLSWGKLADAPRPKLVQSRPIGPDLFSLWRF
jgi:diaminohydroxyphosphoribosylaminopyrimidine deaminase/5-amino-6-(5-phosphoribosylamino)uracil reductase